MTFPLSIIEQWKKTNERRHEIVKHGRAVDDYDRYLSRYESLELCRSLSDMGWWIAARKLRNAVRAMIVEGGPVELSVLIGLAESFGFTVVDDGKERIEVGE